MLLAVSGGYKGLSRGLYENDYQITVDNGGEHATCVSEKDAHMYVGRTCLHVCGGHLYFFLREITAQSLGSFLIELDFFL